METFLNFLWMLMALAAVGAWRACWMQQHRARRRDPVREWTAVVCALVLLFFAVSLSDDLHASVALLDESAGGRRHSALWEAHHLAPDAPPLQLAPAVAFSGFVAFAAPLIRYAPLSPTRIPISGSLHRTLPSGRAPPLSCI